MLNNYYFNLYAVPPLITAFFAVFITVKMLNVWKKSEAIRFFVFFCCSLIVWLLGFSMMYFSAEPNTALFWARVGFLGVTFIPVMALMFIYVLLGKKLKKKTFIILPVFAFICLILNWSTNLFYSGVKLHFWGFYPIAGKLYIVFILMFAALFSTCSVLLFKEAFNYSLPPVRRNQIVYVFSAFTICLFGIVDYIGKYEGIEIYPFGYILIIFFISIIALAIVKYNLLDLKLVLAKTGLYLALYIILFGIPLLIGSKTGSWKVATFSAVIFASIGTMVFNRIREKAENLMLAEQRSYQTILLQAATGMTQNHNLKKLLNMVVHLIKRSVKINFASIYLYDQDTKEYKLVAFRTDKNNDTFKQIVSFREDSAFTDYVKLKRTPFVYEEMPDSARKEVKFNARIGLIVPSFAIKEVKGFMILGEKNSRKPYSPDDINIFNILATQTSIAVENCMFIEAFKKAQEKIFSAEKLASIGGLAEGVAHQINNRLNHFSVIANEMQYELGELKNKLTPLVSDKNIFSEAIKYFQNLSEALSDNVKRTSVIIKGILNYAKVEAQEAKYEEFRFNEVIELSIDLLKVKHNIKSAVPVDYSQIGDKTTMSGIKSIIMESVYNLIDNAYEAVTEMKDYASKYNSDAKYEPRITLTLNNNPISSDITVSDNGIGIKSENLKKLFAPFFTTKSSYKSGSGIGMYVVKRMIEEMHKGNIRVESEYLQGTKVFINLPKK